MLVVSERARRTDTGRARRANEDSYFLRVPLFAVADGMGGAQAGEVASGVAVSVFENGLPDSPGSIEERLAGLVSEANAQIHELSVTDATKAGMGTTLTAVYVGEDDLAIAHVGDSRLYCLRDDVLQRLTRDHSLVEELVQEGRLTPEEAEEHPQRSIITRALGPEADVEVDHMTWAARDGDVYLLCSDGLTSMIAESLVQDILVTSASLDTAAIGLIDAANAAGGRDNITVVLFRIAEVEAGAYAEATAQHAAVSPAAAEQAWEVERRLPRAPAAVAAPVKRKRAPRTRRTLKVLLITLACLSPFAIGGYFASQSVYFVGASEDGFVTLYRGVPYELPFGLRLYTVNYESGVTLDTLPPKVQSTVTGHDLRSRRDGADLVSQIEQGALAGQDG